MASPPEAWWQSHRVFLEEQETVFGLIRPFFRKPTERGTALFRHQALTYPNLWLGQMVDYLQLIITEITFSKPHKFLSLMSSTKSAPGICMDISKNKYKFKCEFGLLFFTFLCEIYLPLQKFEGF